MIRRAYDRADKDEIFAALLLHLWEPALALIEEEVTRVDRPVTERILAFVERLTAHVDERPYLLRLDALAKEVIERNMILPALMPHKEAFLASLGIVGERIEEALGLQAGLLTRMHAMTRGLWQSFGDPCRD